jgi:hypothetical protein
VDSVGRWTGQTEQEKMMKMPSERCLDRGVGKVMMPQNTQRVRVIDVVAR